MGKTSQVRLSYQTITALALAARLLAKKGYTPQKQRKFLAEKARKLEKQTNTKHIVFGIEVIPVDTRNKKYRKLLEYAKKLLQQWEKKGYRTPRGLKIDNKKQARIPRFFDEWIKTKGKGYDLPGLDQPTRKTRKHKKKTRKQ